MCLENLNLILNTMSGKYLKVKANFWAQLSANWI